MAEAQTEREIAIDIAGGGQLAGTLAVPDEATGMVLFAHGSGSSRHSPRNRAVAADLQQRGLGTLLIDLLTQAEDVADKRTGQHRFDIGLLADRLLLATRWLDNESSTYDLALGYFGASTGAAAALAAASQMPDRVRAVVSRGGRPDLAGDALEQTQAPTLLIVGGRDQTVIELNQQAADRLTAPVHTEIVPGATHLFEEPGALEQVARLAADWFTTYL
jgi:dienelactone hydrolase